MNINQKRFCGCGNDISDRHALTKYCGPCSAKKRQEEYKKYNKVNREKINERAKGWKQRKDRAIEKAKNNI